jgi:hypothetical protein
MPLGKDVSKNIHELYADNKKSGKEKGAGGKPRPRKQIIAIAMSAAGKSNKKKRRTSDGYTHA